MGAALKDMWGAVAGYYRANDARLSEQGRLNAPSVTDTSWEPYCVAGEEVSPLDGVGDFMAVLAFVGFFVGGMLGGLSGMFIGAIIGPLLVFGLLLGVGSLIIIAALAARIITAPWRIYNHFCKKHQEAN